MEEEYEAADRQRRVTRLEKHLIAIEANFHGNWINGTKGRSAMFFRRTIVLFEK